MMKRHGNYILPTVDELRMQPDASYIKDMVNRLRKKASNDKRHYEKTKKFRMKYARK